MLEKPDLSKLKDYVEEILCINSDDVKRTMTQTLKRFQEPTPEFSRKWLMVMLFCVIFVNKDLLYFGTVNGYLLVFSQIITCVCLLAVIAYIVVHKVKLNTPIMRTFFPLAVLIIMSAVFNLDFRLGYVYALVLYALCALLLVIAGPDGIYEFLYKTMTVVCTVSVILFAIQKVMPQLLDIFPTIWNTGGIPFRFAVVSNVDAEFGTFQRNWGPFREPGVFQMFVMVSLMYGLFRRKKVGFLSVLMHILAIATTFSTTGYIALAMVVLAMITQKKETMHNWPIYKIVMVVTCIGVLYLAFFTDLLFTTGEMSYASVFGKLFAGLGSASMGSRFASIRVNLLMFLERPLFGGGMSYVDTRFGEICSELYGNPQLHNTNTLFVLLSTFGLVFAVVAAARICFFFFEYYRGGMLSKLLLLTSYLCLLIGENMILSFIVMLPVFYVTKTEKKVMTRVSQKLASVVRGKNRSDASANNHANALSKNRRKAWQ